MRNRSRSPATPTVAAVVLPGERTRVDAAGSGYFAVVHRESIPDAVRAVRERPVDAILVSVHRCDAAQMDDVARLVRHFPSIPTVALLTQPGPDTTERLLQLGASGVRQVVDVSRPVGWERLRLLVSEPASRAAARIQGPLLAELPDMLAPDARLFVEALVRLAPGTPTIRDLARRLRVEPSTLLSRFLRADLPSPRTYLSAVRLLHAAHLFEDRGLSIADVSFRLEYSSPQGFGRHLRALWGITAQEFRSRFPFDVALERVLAALVRPYRRRWEDFRPLGRRRIGARPGQR